MIEKIFYEIDEDFWCESKYLNGVYNNIKDKLEGDYSVVITPNLRNLPKTNYKKIVFLTGDETFRLGMNPYSNDNVEAVFRIFNRNGTFDNKYIYPIPPGYNWTMHSDRTKKMVRMYPEKKLSERKYDISFIGQALPWRKPIFDILDNLSKSFNIYHGMNNSFRTGMHIDEYYRLLGDTKIVLSPDGTTIDCFRYVEALGSGCIVITTNKDDIWYYRNSPVFFINSWNELNEDLIRNILSMNIDEI
jgi:glycosyltransferase involved in cell wall biosynthesis